MRSTLQALLVLTTLTIPAVVHADAADPQVTRLLSAKSTLKWNHSPFGQDRYGHAEALVNAPADKVAKTATDFAHYRDLHRKFATARVVAREGDKTDVFMKYPVQIGRLKLELQETMRFSGIRESGGKQIIEATGLRGDMKKGHTIITVKPVDEKHSLLQLDVLLVPSFPAPQSFIDEELRDGAEDFVNGVKDRAQGRPGPVTSL